MANFILSAFADEISPDFDAQLDALNKLDIPYIELRGVDGKSFVELTDDEVKKVKTKLDSHGIKVWSLGSPIGKAKTNELENQLKLLERVMEIGEMLDVKRIRCFSFYREDGDSNEVFESKVFACLESLLDAAEKRGFTLCHENEKDIYGESKEDVKKLASNFNGRLKLVLDNGNFVFSGHKAEGAYELLKDNIEYLHIKDCVENCVIVPPGKGYACIEDTLKIIDKEKSGNVVLTVEPHLMSFIGLGSLAKEETIKHSYSFDSPYAAFECAASNIRCMLNSL